MSRRDGNGRCSRANGRTVKWAGIGEVRLEDGDSAHTLVFLPQSGAPARLSPRRWWKRGLGSHRGPRGVYINATAVPDLDRLHRALIEKLEEWRRGPEL